MKKIAIILLIIMILCGCGKEKPIIATNIETGVFLVTPQEFIEQWNSDLENFQKKSDDKKAQYILPLPDFEKSEQVMPITEGLSISYTAEETSGYLKEIAINQYVYTQTNEGALTAGFIVSAIPYYFNSNPSVDISKEFGLQNLSSDMDIKDTVDDNVSYSYYAVDGASKIIVKPIKLEK